MKKVCKCLYDAIFASLQTLERECRSPGGVAFALPSVTHTLRFPVLRTAAEIGCFRYPWVSLSLYPRLLPRLSFGELKVPTPCFHELCTRLESGGWALPPYIGSLLPMCAIPKCQCTTNLRHVEAYRHTNGSHRLFL